MNTTLTSSAGLITHIDGNETPELGRWSVVPAHTWLILHARPGPFAGPATAFGAAVSGTFDVAADPEHCRMRLTVDTRRLTCDRPRMARALGEQELSIDAVRTGRFATGGWDIAGSIASADEERAFDAWIDYRGVYRRPRDLAYAWFTMNLTIPASVLGMFPGPMWWLRDAAMHVDVLATADRSATSTAA